MKKKNLPQGLHRDTLAVRAGIEPSQYGENSEALYLTSGFLQPDAETSAHRFANPQEGYTYGRTSNPTVTGFEQRLAAMEGTEAAIGTSTGMANPCNRPAERKRRRSGQADDHEGPPMRRRGC